MKVITKIKIIRESKKITRENISKFLSISSGTYRDIENEKIRLSLENFLLICEFLQISPMELLKENDDHYILLSKEDINNLNKITNKINNQSFEQNIQINSNNGNIEINQNKNK